MNAKNDTANHILDIAERYTQTRGFNAFSYRDIQDELGIKTSSIHYHFATKHDLAIAMIERYLESYQAALGQIDDKHSKAVSKLQALGDVFILGAKQGKFCLCGMLAADILAMPNVVEQHLDQFFSLSEEWITHTLKQGIADGEISNLVNPKNAAAHFLAALEGGMLIARTRKQPKYLAAVISHALAQLEA